VIKEGLVIVLTGAGISAESSIPTFRGPEGYWTIGSRNYHPQELATAEAFSRMPAEVWGWYLYRRSASQQASPNPGHLALGQLERRLGDRFLLVTQNVDGLHLRAGSSRLFEIHGNIDFMRCSQACCAEKFPIVNIRIFGKQQQLSPDQLASLRCPRCEAMARPHVLWFDECYDEELYRFESSRKAARECAALISVGTSGSTNLPLQMGALAVRNQALLIDVNLQDNPFSKLALSNGGRWLKMSASDGIAHILNEFGP
jgi:NAD-dependent deacetylase